MINLPRNLPIGESLCISVLLFDWGTICTTLFFQQGSQKNHSESSKRPTGLTLDTPKTTTEPAKFANLSFCVAGWIILFTFLFSPLSSESLCSSVHLKQSPETQNSIQMSQPRFYTSLLAQSLCWEVKKNKKSYLSTALNRYIAQLNAWFVGILPENWICDRIFV